MIFGEWEIKLKVQFKTSVTASSFRWRAAKAYNELPTEMRNMKTLKEFKKTARKWVMQNTPLTWLWMGAGHMFITYYLSRGGSLVPGGPKLLYYLSFSIKVVITCNESK